MTPKIEETLKALRFEADIYVGSSTSVVCQAAADLIEQLQQELIDERCRHGRLQDFCVAQGDDLSALKKKYMALLDGKEEYGPLPQLLPKEEDRCMENEQQRLAQGEELSEIKARQRWIPVTERLPEVSMRTLVSIDDCVGVAYFIHGNSGMCFFSDYTGKPLTFVTHWMPLPEPPMEE